MLKQTSKLQAFRLPNVRRVQDISIDLKFRNWFDKNAEINIEIVEDEKNKIE